MSVMITGGTGLVGSHLARYLIQEKGESSVTIFDPSTNYANFAEIQDNLNIVRGDVLQLPELLDAMQKYDVDRVVHLAFVLGAPVYVNPYRAIQINCIGTTNVFEAARLHGVKRVAYASSAAIHAHRRTIEDEEQSEDVMPRPGILYGACKLFNELEAEFYVKHYNLDVIGIRPPMVFGTGKMSRGIGAPGSWGDAPGMVLQGRPVVMPPDDQLGDWIYGMDAADVWYRALTVENPPHRLYNMKAQAIRMEEWKNTLLKLLPEAQITVSSEPVEIDRLMSNKRLRTDLGWEPQYTVEKAMAEYIERVRTGKGPP